MLGKLDDPMAALKKQFGLTKEEWEQLGQLKYNGTMTDIESLNSISKTRDSRSNWVLQTDSDMSLLDDRITYCDQIRNMVREDFAQLLSDANLVTSSDLTFAPVKQ